MTTGATNSR